MSMLTATRADMCYCPGCSHGVVLEQLGHALDHIGVPRSRVCIVSDIGCIGTADRYFDCHTFHGLHGRSIAYAEGIKRANPELLVVVLIGDGGCGIGTAHLVHAARRRADIKVIVCNNFNFGMTGGQHSSTTPTDTRTTTTPGGATDEPFDVCRTVSVNGAGFVARYDAFDPQLKNKIQQALGEPGFVLLDVWELCTAYFVPANKLNRGSIETLSSELGMPFGVVDECRGRKQSRPVQPPRTSRVEPPSIDSSHQPTSRQMIAPIQWLGRREICVAGSAGQRVRSAVGILGEIAVAGGLFAAQQDDFPITVRRGFSISNLIISHEPIRYTATDAPDVVVILSLDGLARLGSVPGWQAAKWVVAPDDLAMDAGPANLVRFDLRKLEKQVGRESVSLAALVFSIVQANLIAAETLASVAAALLVGRFRQSNLDAIAGGIALIPKNAGVS